MATQGYVSSKKVVSSRESEARPLFEGDWEQKKLKGRVGVGVFPLSLDIRAELERTGTCTKHTGCKMTRDLEACKGRKMKQLSLVDSTSIDRGAYLYLNIVVGLQVLIIGPLLALPPDIRVIEWENTRSWQTPHRAQY